MKITFTSFIILVFSTMSISINAQISTFYSLPNTGETKFGYPLTTTSETSKTIQFNSLTNEIVELIVEWTFSKANIGQDDVLTFSIGDKQQVGFQLNIKDDKQYIIENGKAEEGQFLDSYGYPDKDYTSRIFRLKISQSYIQICKVGEIGGIYYLQQQPIDNKSITIQAQSSSSTFIHLTFNDFAYPKLSCFAKSGLRVRASDDLNSKVLTTIPYGKEVTILRDNQDLNVENADYYHQVADTKGNIKTDKLKSRMIKVLYNGKIGYAYGGYLLPLLFKNEENNVDNIVQLNDWTCEYIPFDKVQVNDKVSFFKTTIDFRNYHWSGLSHSQRIYLLEALFQNIFNQPVTYPAIFNQHDLFYLMNNSTADKSADEEIANFQYKIKAPFEGGTIEATLFFNQNEPVLFEYIERKNSFLENVQSDFQYITATSLNVRATSETSSKIIHKVKLGDKISTHSYNDYTEVIGGIRGTMTGVYLSNDDENENIKEGFVFDAYLSPIEPLSDFTTFFRKNQPSKNGIKHFCDYLYNERNYCTTASYQPNWLVVPARDKFQLVKAFRKAYPELENVKFEWNAAKFDYDITTSSLKVNIRQTKNTWCFLIGGDDEYERPMIIIETLDNNVFKVSVIEEFMGD